MWINIFYRGLHISYVRYNIANTNTHLTHKIMFKKLLYIAAALLLLWHTTAIVGTAPTVNLFFAGLFFSLLVVLVLIQFYLKLFKI